MESQISAKIDDGILKNFRDTIYFQYGLKKGDFKKALEDAMSEYVKKYKTQN
ncbi:MAG: hypothetical protein ACT4OW_02610 [Nitrososphaerota archaeon]